MRLVRNDSNRQLTLFSSDAVTPNLGDIHAQERRMAESGKTNLVLYNVSLSIR